MTFHESDAKTREILNTFTCTHGSFDAADAITEIKPETTTFVQKIVAR